MNTTDNIKSLFNSANPMATENSYEPSGVCIGDTLLDNTPSGFALFQAIGGHYTSPAQAIEELGTTPFPPSGQTAAAARSSSASRMAATMSTSPSATAALASRTSVRR